VAGGAAALGPPGVVSFASGGLDVQPALTNADRTRGFHRRLRVLDDLVSMIDPSWR
jgi:hypothetical protein